MQLPHVFLRYLYSRDDTCVCGELYTVKGGYVILRHNSLRDLFAEILEEVCSDVQIEPPLLPLTGEKLPHGSNTSPCYRCQGQRCNGRRSKEDCGFIR